MATGYEPSLIEVPDRSVYALLSASDQALCRLETLATMLEDPQAAAALAPTMDSLKNAMRQMRRDLEPVK